MVKSLHIEHYALIDELDINLHSGFSVITGETGAGKSIILGAIGLLLGERADVKAIKAGEKRCVIEAKFDLSAYRISHFFTDNDLDFDESECIIRRELTAAGKSRAFINDTPVTLSLLKELGGQLIDIHSQHQNLLLGKEDFQLDVLDVLAQNQEDVARYSQLFSHYKEISHQLEELKSQARSSRDEEDYLRFQANQLADAALVEGEQEQLEEEQEMLTHAEEIKQSLYEAFRALNSEDETDTLQHVQQSISALRNIESVFPLSADMTQRLESCYIELKDIAEELEGQAGDVEYNPQRLEQVSDRLSLIYSLQKKHHVDSVRELLQLLSDMENHLLAIDGSDERITELEREKSQLYQDVMAQAQRLSETRQGAKKKLEAEIVELLMKLGMPHVQFVAEMSPKVSPDVKGTDKVTFLFSANKNIPVQPLSQIASGGEIARVMLSLKALIASAVNLPTVIFDEIDTGLSGKIAEQMALVMQGMGNHGRQVISITHLPQIAALGQHHYKVYKEDSLFASSTHIIELNSAQRIEEIAHMLSGANLTEAALSNARELIKS